MSTQTKEDLEQEYGKLLLEGEAIEAGYQLIRDAIVFTNERILFVDRQKDILQIHLFYEYR